MAAVQDIDRGWKRIQKELKSLDKSFTKVGLPEEATPAPTERRMSAPAAARHKTATAVAAFSAMRQMRRAGANRTRTRKAGKQAAAFVGSKASSRTISELVLIGVVNEFGSKVKHIPSRPAFRRAFDKNRKRINDLKQVILGKIFTGDLTARQGLGLVGEYLTNATKKEITDLKSPPNAPVTIKRKGSSNPLIDTGQMRASVTHVEVMG